MITSIFLRISISTFSPIGQSKTVDQSQAKKFHLFARARAASLPWPSALVGACTRAVVKHVAALEEEEEDVAKIFEGLKYKLAR